MDTFEELLSTVNRLKPNTVDDEDKFGWINDVEAQVYEKVYSRAADTTFTYSAKAWDTDQAAALLIPYPYSEMYMYYLFAKIDLMNGEIGSYNNNMTLFKDGLDEFAAYYRRNHLPK